MKRNTTIRDAIGFDDILLVPSETQVKPDEVQTRTRLTKTIELAIPVISSGTASITESAMAIALAQMGGLGIIHDNMPLGKQVEEVRRVKRAGGTLVRNPITISPDSPTAEAYDLMTTYKISGLPVIESGTQKVVGIITGRDLRFFEDYAQPVSELMTKNVITVRPGTDEATAKRLMHEHRIEKLIIVDGDGKCVGLMTVKDFDKAGRYPTAARDAHGNLRVGAAVSLGKDALDRTAAMADAGLDVVFIDVAHAHNKDAVNTVSRIRQQRSTDIQVIAGNVATAAAARSLIDAGADAVKVGIGGFAGMATRKQAGVGVPQLMALMDVVEECGMQDVPVLLDGGVDTPADFAKAIAAGAHAAVFSQLFEHTDEVPVHAAPKPPGFDVYRLDENYQVAQHRGTVVHAVNTLMTGLKNAMAYTGAKDIRTLQENAEFVRAK
jgi:IMP dehydrogenase